jgi:arylsulfatase A
MTRPQQCITPLAASLLLSAGCAPEPSTDSVRVRSDDPPNIVFIMVDDLGSRDLSCYGSELIETPRIDAMAASGIHFTNAYSGCTVCAPARSTLMTGYHMGHTPVRGNTGGIPLADADVTLAEVLHEAGYVTGGFGKWGLGEVGTEGVPEQQGFDVFLGNYHQIHAHYYYTDYLWRNSERVTLEGNAGFYDARPGPAAFPPIDPETKQERTYAHDVMFDAGLEFIRAHQDEPFFCYLPWNVPHGRFEIPEDDPAWTIYRDKQWPIRSRVAAAMTTMIDRQVGEVLDLLVELEIDEETIVFFCSDNGGDMGASGPLRRNGELRGGKRSMYEGGIRVPLIVSWPGRIESGRVSAVPCYFPDIMPTLCELAKATDLMPTDIDGVSLAPILFGDVTGAEDVFNRPYLYWEWPAYNWGKRIYPEDGLMQGVRFGPYKGLRHRTTDPIEIYDISVDPSEQHDLAAERPDLVARAQAYMDEAHEPPRPQVEPERIDGRPYR